MNSTPGRVTLRHRSLALALLVTVLWSLYLLIGQPVVQAALRLDEALESARFRQEKLHAGVAELEARPIPDADAPDIDIPIVVKAPAAVVLSALQDIVRSGVRGPGTNLRRMTNATQAPDDQGLSAITLELDMESDIEGLKRLLYTIESHRPLVFVESLLVRRVPAKPGRQPSAAQRLDIRLRIAQPFVGGQT